MCYRGSCAGTLRVNNFSQTVAVAVAAYGLLRASASRLSKLHRMLGCDISYEMSSGGTYLKRFPAQGS